MTWLPIAAVLVAIVATICGVGFGLIGVDSRDGRTGRSCPSRATASARTIGRVVEFTDWAIEILAKAERAARRFNPEARLRVARDSSAGVRFELTEAPDPADAVVERDGFTLFVEAGLEGLVDVVEPHDRLVLRPPGSAPSPR
ncbi:MAG TPA: hypothetical protein VGR41_08745 [Actinomycetota bacterium]|nr:hypothetical protein [Actinomycetota bacterium]